MKIRMVGGLLVGSVFVHAVIVACTATPASGDRDAAADPTGAPADTSPEVSPEPCSATYEAATPDPRGDAGTRTMYYAEHAYPGKSKFEIAAHVTHWTAIDDPAAELRPPVYKDGLNLQTGVYARDGFAGAGCRPGTTGYFVWRR